MTKTEAPPPGVRLLHSLRGEGVWFGRLKWSPGGNRIAVGASDETIWVWETRNEKLLRKIEAGPRAPFAFAWIGNSHILTWSKGWPAPRSQSVLSGPSREIRLQRLTGEVLAWDCSLDGNTIAGITDDQRVRLWESKTGTLVGEINDTWKAEDIAWSPEGTLLLLRDREGSYWIREARSGELLPLSRQVRDMVRAFAWSRDAKLLAIGIDKIALVESAETGGLIRRLERHSGRIKSLSFSADGSMLASKSSDGTVRLWSCDHWKEVAALAEPTSEKWPPGVAFHPRDKVLATLGEGDSMVRVWNLDNLLSVEAEWERRHLRALERAELRLTALTQDMQEWILINLDRLTNKRAKDHLYTGFLQRHMMMSASRARIFGETHNRGNLLSPELTIELNIHLNAFYLNLRGSLDNLAWILAFELGLNPKLSEEDRSRSFSDLFWRDFQKALTTRRPTLVRRLQMLDAWQSEVKRFRDPAAHRIPLLVTPGIQTLKTQKEREALARAASEALSSRDFQTYTSLQYQIRNLAVYKPTFARSPEGGLELYWLSGKIQKDQRVLLRIARAVLSEFLGPVPASRYQEWRISRWEDAF